MLEEGGATRALISPHAPERQRRNSLASLAEEMERGTYGIPDLDNLSRAIQKAFGGCLQEASFASPLGGDRSCSRGLAHTSEEILLAKRQGLVLALLASSNLRVEQRREDLVV